MSRDPSPDGDSQDHPVAEWERQPGESAKAYHAFCCYRDLGPRDRSLRRVAKTLGHRGLSHIERWSSQNRWLERTAAYDDHLDELQRQEHQKNLLQLERGELQLIRLLRGGVMRRLLGFDGNGDPEQAVEAIDLNKLTANELAAWAREATRMASSRPERKMQRKEAIAKAASLEREDLFGALRDLYKIFESFVPDTSKPLAGEMIRAYLNGDITLRQIQTGKI